MAPLHLTYYPTPSLQQRSADLPHGQISAPEIQELIGQMEETMRHSKGVGLAAPQIGQNIRLCIVETQTGPMALINPKIVRRSLRKNTDLEGCLSIPGVFGNVRRHSKIVVKALDRDGQPLKFTARGFFARVIQHEVDHLDGVLFIQRAKDITEGQELLEKMERKS